jgi:ABC-2 type transport system permease protein
MLAYWVMLQQALRRELAYPARNWVDLAGDGLRVLFWAALWSGLYAVNGPPALQAGAPTVSLHVMLTYAVVAIWMRGLLESHTTAAIRDKVRSGAIATDLLKPVSLPLMIAAESGGRFLYRAGVTALLIGAVAWPLRLHGPVNLPLFLLSGMLGWGVTFAINFLLHTVAFWTLESEGIRSSVRYVGHIISGSIVPVWFFPEWLERAAMALPFPAMYHVPLTLYFGRATGAKAARLILLQLFWILALAAASVLVWRRGLRRVVVQGG